MGRRGGRLSWPHVAGKKKSKHKKRPPGKRPSAGAGGASPARGKQAGATAPPADGATAGTAEETGRATAREAGRATAGEPPAGPGTKQPRGRGGQPPGGGKPTRAARIEAARRARRRKALLIRLAVVGVVVAVLAAVAYTAFDRRREERALRARLTAGSCTFDTRSDPTDRGTQSHVASPTYEVDPPAGGNHMPAAAAPAVYGAESVPPDGRLVHALEHGDVVLWYRPGLDQEALDALTAVAERYTNDVLVVPRRSLEQTVAATAWGKRLLCGELEPGRIAEFVRAYRDKGPEQPDE